MNDDLDSGVYQGLVLNDSLFIRGLSGRFSGSWFLCRCLPECGLE